LGICEIGDNTAIGAQSGISKNISAGHGGRPPAVPLEETALRADSGVIANLDMPNDTNLTAN